ncbi:hypothetical protein [Tardiphaga sp. 841_E9_N1_2]|uniref:hypothetical protein n=1 Tax=Tardiphaga sp. 841_E9_N1_2 TaxID=3240762 RepID=UPI003F22C5CD
MPNALFEDDAKLKRAKRRSTMPFNQYRRNLNAAILANKDPDGVVLQATHTWFAGGGRAELQAAFEHETGLKIGNRKDGALVEQGYPKNINEYPGKTAWDQYYIANAIIALQELDRIFQPGKPYPTRNPDIFYRNLVGLSRKLFLDTIVLLDDWATFKQGLQGVFGIGKNRLEHATPTYHSALQVIYGNCSPFAFSDNHSDTSVNQLRMAIELRLRRGFGVTAKLNKAGSIVPLALSEIIQVVALHKQNITFAVPFEHIDRIYQWSNIYMHTGLKQYVWSPIFALHYLRPFLLGGKHAGGTSSNAGIIAAPGVVKQVQSGIENGADKSQFDFVFEDLANCDLILKP